MIDFFKKHKKLFVAFVVAVLTALIALFNGLVACTSTGMWKADFKKVSPRYEYNAPTSDVNELGGVEK